MPQFYGLGEVCLVGSVNYNRPVLDNQACGNDDGEASSVPSTLASRRPSESANDTRDSSAGSSYGVLATGANAVELEVEYLRSRLDIATKLLADQEETIDTLTSELTAFKSLYKETIQEVLSTGPLAASASCGTPSPETPVPRHPWPGRVRSVLQLSATAAAAIANINLDDDDDNDDNKSIELGKSSGVTTPQQVAARPFATSRSPAVEVLQSRSAARLGRFYSWREGRKRGTSAAPVTPLPQQLLSILRR